MMCPECEAFRRGEGGHRALIEQAVQDLRPGHESSHYVRRYICHVCATPWKYEHDRKSTGVGWSLLQQSEAEA